MYVQPTVVCCVTKQQAFGNQLLPRGGQAKATRKSLRVQYGRNEESPLAALQPPRNDQTTLVHDTYVMRRHRMYIHTRF